jgi:hypothetical protein
VMSRMKAKHHPVRNSAARLERLAGERAEQQARQIPWQRLYDTRNQYIDWQEFYLWIRSILEVEDTVPDWLVEILNKRCPGFLESEKKPSPKTLNRPLPLRLEDWIDDHVFSFAKQEGWFSAVTFYAIRESRYRRAEVCWSQCVEQWKKAKPVRYPSLEEWKTLAAQCDETAHLLPHLRKALVSRKRVADDRHLEAVSRYIEWEAFAYWVRPALEISSPLPREVACELGRRCPGFLEDRGHAKAWQRLLCWIANRYLEEEKTEGWFKAILLDARKHPRAIRTMEYADQCQERWGARQPDPYPSFEEWRANADAYVETSSVVAR